MSDHFSQESVDSTSDWKEPACALCGNAKSTLIADKCCASTGLISPVTKTSTSLNTHPQLTSSVEDFPASRSQLPAREEEKPMNAGFGPRCEELLPTIGPDGSSSRTSEGSPPGGLRRSWKTWKPSATKERLTSHPLVPLVPHTNAKECSLLPTLSAGEPGWRHIEIVDKNGDFPTHQHQRWYDRETMRWVQKGTHHVLSFLVGVPFADGMRLHPSFAEWMMGFPKGWTELGLSETPLSRKSRNTSDD